jgi:hypothetical protein
MDAIPAELTRGLKTMTPSDQNDAVLGPKHHDRVELAKLAHTLDEHGNLRWIEIAVPF